MYINVYEFIADMRFYDFCCQTLDGGLKSTSLTGLGLMELHQCCTIRIFYICLDLFKRQYAFPSHMHIVKKIMDIIPE
jgi:hypothetical protein